MHARSTLVFLLKKKNYMYLSFAHERPLKCFILVQTGCLSIIPSTRYALLEHYSILHVIIHYCATDQYILITRIHGEKIAIVQHRKRWK